MSTIKFLYPLFRRPSSDEWLRVNALTGRIQSTCSKGRHWTITTPTSRYEDVVAYLQTLAPGQPEILKVTKDKPRPGESGKNILLGD